MELKSYFNSVVKGVVGAFSVTVLLTAIFSLLVSFVEFSPSVFSGVFVVITSFGLIFGTIVAARLHGEKGWLVGLAVGILFYIALYVTGVLFGAESTLGAYVLIKFSLCVLVGTLSGMLGINLGKE